jgi:ABC-type Fe3+ transport system substrate-binding protein
MMLTRGRMLALLGSSPFYTAAKHEGALHLYTGGAASNSAGLIAAFNREFPGIEVTVTGAYSNVNDKLIEQQLREKKVVADIASFQTVQDFVAWKRAGELLPFKFDGFEFIDPRYKDPDGAFVATTLNPLTYAYNPRLVAPKDVPRSAQDFLSPRFRGLAITCYPHDDDATLYLFYTLAQKYGWGFIDAYMATQPDFVEGHLGVARAIAAGRKLVTFDCSAHMATEMKAHGAPIDVAFSKIDPIPVFYNTSGILRAAPHPNAAKLFTAWYLSRDQQINTGTWSARRDVPPPPGMKALSVYPLANGYRDFLVQTELVANLRERFLAYTGPVVNRS